MIKTRFNIIIAISIVIFSQTALSASDKNMASAAFKNGDYSSAIQHYRKILTSKESPKIYTDLGHCYYQLKDWHNAEAAYISAIELYAPTPHPEIIRYLANAQYMSDANSQAALNYHKARSIDPQPGDDLLIARCLVKMDQWILAQDYVTIHLQQYPQDIEALELLAHICTASGKNSDAVAIAKQLARQNPGKLHYLMGLANAQATGRNYADAIDTLEFSLRTIDLQNLEANRMLADLYLAEYMYHQAIGCYQRIISQQDKPSDRDYFRLGCAYFQTKRNLAAREAFSNVVELSPSDYQAHIYLGNIAAEELDTEKARSHYLNPIQAGPSSPAPSLVLANLEMNNKQYLA
ncbi:MAG: tetratricopeptide repeat protein, partial [Planctomycetes bacterium]|nr:tetratricopeptide repeat protein [Planctomycetota bacterium]